MHKGRYCLCAAVLMLAGAGCNRSDGGKVNATQAAGPVRTASLVEASHPERRDISSYLEETGIVTAESQVEVLAKGTGHCLLVRVEEGDLVSDGDVLAELDKAEMEAQVRQSEVNLAQQRIVYERTEKGLSQGIFSRAERDNAQASYEQAKATLEMQRVQLSFLTIRAPISGVVTRRMLQEGMLVSTGMPVFNIVDPNSFILPINVAERYIPRLRVGQEARVRIDSVGDRRFLARVRRINPGVDPQTGTVKVVLEFERADHPYLRESAFARYSLVMETHENALVVPKDAIVEENAQRHVMVVRKAQAETGEAGAEGGGASGLEASRIAVETGLEDAFYTEILSGIGEDDLVITLGQQTVKDGEPIRAGNLEETLESRGALPAGALLDQAREDRRQIDAADSGGSRAETDAPDS
ncbi:MAG: efflux RND transporter periplasmic adaptor subunit [Candidatus Hydrogenedentes bacterium]|nr:efflux RND transporter periplasmic adaptor subunit [Candidatus Hydrogenedentota bacterium]